MKGGESKKANETSKTWFYKLPAARPENLIFLIKRFENFQKKPSKIFKNAQKNPKYLKTGEILIVKKN